MGDKTKIEWAEASWNPVTGCSKISEGCRNCYALRHWPRLAGNDKTVYYGRKFTDVQCHPERLDQPLRWTKPRRIFVNSMSDLFHPDVPDDFILKVFNIMRQATWSGGAGLGKIKSKEREGHVFQVLTKRPERMLELVSRIHFDNNEGYILGETGGQGLLLNKDIWLGVSVENQETANQRIPLLLQTPAAVRWISAEPLLGPINLEEICIGHETEKGRSLKPVTMNSLCDYRDHNRLAWVICGGESGPEARPMHPEWVRNLRDQCQKNAVPFLFKQWGEWSQSKVEPIHGQYITGGILLHKKGFTANHQQWWDGEASFMEKLGSKTNGRLLDGILHDQYPV